MVNRLLNAFVKTKNNGKLIHCITNPISINQCANTVLSLGCKPIMAEHPEEVKEITATSDALLVNLGNITDVRKKSIKRSCKTAKENGIPIVFDMVGIACSSLRKKYAKKIIKKYAPEIIKGNYSEIYALYENEYEAKGVDSEALDISKITDTAAALSDKLGCTVLASGRVDIVAADGKCTYVRNGVSQLSAVTGTGCMLGTITAACVSSNPPYIAAVLACALLGIAGERAECPKKNGTFMINLMDELSSLNIKTLEDMVKAEEITGETINEKA